MPVTTTTDVSPAVSPYYDRNLLENARALLIHDQFGQVRPLPQRSSKSIKFRRPNTLAVAKTPLVEGVTPTGKTFGYAEVLATVNQYGDFVAFSDVVSLVNQDAVLTDITTEQGFQSGETIDELRRDVLVAGTSVQYANDSSRAAVNTVMTQGDIETVIRELQNQNAMMIMEKINAGRGISTEPIAAAFFAIIHPDIIPTIEGFTDFIPVRKYASTGPIMTNEVGSVKNVRFVWTTKAKVWLGGGASGGSNVKETSSAADVYGTLVFARNAYGIVPLEGKSLESIVKAVGSGGSSDPLNQRGTSGWKAHTTTVILNNAFMYRIESAAKDAL
jgi:N4-gp56 family major capsid protein